MSKRLASHAGQWYSSDANALNIQLDDWLKMSGTLEHENPESIKAIISPRAGYKYSGKLAASVFAHLKNLKPKLIVILGPSHYKLLRNQCAVSIFSHVQTPIGDLEIDSEVKIRLSDSSHFEILSPEEDKEEHSLEMLFPFISKMLDANITKILPIQVGYFTDPSIRRFVASHILRSIYSIPFEDVIFAISSDFCHYGSRFEYMPKFPESKQSLNESISILDRKGFDTLNEPLPMQAFTEYLDLTNNTICGRGPILLFLEIIYLAKLNGHWELIDYAQSNIVKSVNDNCVSYLGALFKISKQE